MSIFSQLLSDHIHNKKIRVYTLADYCGIDPSLMYKIIHGKRKITSVQSVNRIAEYLRLTPEELLEFTEAFEIESQGYENYYRRKDFLKFLNDFKQIANISTVNLTPETSDISDLAIRPLHNASEVNQAVMNIITHQVQKSNGEINMMIRTDYPFLVNLIVSTAHHCTDLTINHIVCLNNADQLTDRKSFNLHCLCNILPLCTCGCSYIPYYYYDNTVNVNELRLFPYFIITDHQAIILSATLQSGILINQADLIQLLQSMFIQYKSQTRMLLNKLNNIYEQMNYIQYSFSLPSQSHYSLQMTPCITDLLTPDILDKYINPALPSRDLFLKGIENYITEFRCKTTENKLIFIFSEEGIKEFLKTGTFEEYSKQLYTPVEPEDRIRIIKRFIQKCRTYPERMYMLRHSIGTVRNGANIYVNSQCGYLLFTPVGYDTPIWLDIRESGLLSAFLDFFEYLIHQDMFFPTEETPERLEHLVQEFSSELK